MKKLINFLIAAAIGIAILYMISVVLAIVVLVVAAIVNRIMTYRKKHRRFTDWDYKYTRQANEKVGNHMQIKRTFIFERFDRFTNAVEIKEDIRITPIKDYDNLKAEEFAEWLSCKTIEKRFNDQKVMEYYSSI